MTVTARTDVHRPSTLVTEHYDVIAYGWFGGLGEPGHSPLAHEAAYLLDEGWRFGENHSAGACFSCGARLKYYALAKHLPTHTLVRIGETCADRFDIPTARFHEMRKRAELDRKRMRIKTRRAAWFAVDEDRLVAFEWADAMVKDGDYGYEGMRHSFVHNVNRYGDTSDKFVRTIMRDMIRTERFAEERAARNVAEAMTSSPVIEGRQVLTGEVLSVKFQENDYGSRHVMTVRDDRGFKVWGSVPSSIDPERGDRVTLTATVEASDRDETFGFFKRPSKASILIAD